MRKFVMTTSSGSQQTLRCTTKHEANRVAKQAAELIGWVVVSVVEIK